MKTCRSRHCAVKHAITFRSVYNHYSFCRIRIFLDPFLGNRTLRNRYLNHVNGRLENTPWQQKATGTDISKHGCMVVIWRYCYIMYMYMLNYTSENLHTISQPTKQSIVSTVVILAPLVPCWQCCLHGLLAGYCFLFSHRPSPSSCSWAPGLLPPYTYTSMARHNDPGVLIPIELYDGPAHEPFYNVYNMYIHDMEHVLFHEYLW